MSVTNEELIKKLKNLDIVYREEVDLSHAGKSNFYVDIKKAYGYPDVFGPICDAIGERIDKRTTCIAAAGYGGISPASVLSLRYNLKLALIRTKPKDHGIPTLVDGQEPTNLDKVLIYDDVLTTGETIEDIINVIRPYGSEIIGCCVFVKRMLGDVNLGIPFSYVLTAEDLM
jgi:orotate phosphoribosyltransferase